MFLDLAKFCKEIGKNNGVISITTLGYMELIDELGQPKMTEIAKTRKEYQTVFAMVRKHADWFELKEDKSEPSVGRPAKRIKLSPLGKKILLTAKNAYRLGLFAKSIEQIDDGYNLSADVPTIVIREDVESSLVADAEVTLTVNDENEFVE